MQPNKNLKLATPKKKKIPALNTLKIYRHALSKGGGKEVEEGEGEAAPKVATFHVCNFANPPLRSGIVGEVRIVGAPFCGCAGEIAKSLATISLNTSEFPAYYNITTVTTTPTTTAT